MPKEVLVSAIDMAVIVIKVLKALPPSIASSLVALRTHSSILSPATSLKTFDPLRVFDESLSAICRLDITFEPFTRINTSKTSLAEFTLNAAWKSTKYRPAPGTVKL